MPQVSKRFLNKKTEERIFSLFLGSIISCNSKDTALSLIEELLTPTEKVMLAKRFSIMFMLLEGYDYETIEETLKVSRSTVGYTSTWLKLKGVGIKRIIEKIKRDEALKSIWVELQDGILDILSNSKGVNWSKAKSMLWQSRHDRQKAF